MRLQVPHGAIWVHRPSVRPVAAVAVGSVTLAERTFSTIRHTAKRHKAQTSYCHFQVNNKERRRISGGEKREKEKRKKGIHKSVF